MRKSDIISCIVIFILGLLLVKQCKSNSSLNDELKRQHNNISAMTDTLKQYKDDLGRANAEKHAYQLTQKELRDSIGLLKKKNTDYVSYINANLGIRDTIFETTYIDRTVSDPTISGDNGNIVISRKDIFGKSMRELSMTIPYYVDDKLHTNEASINLSQDIFVEGWLERNSKTGETMMHLRSDYPNVNFNSGMGIVATSSPNYERSMRKTKGIGLNVGPQIGISYDMNYGRIVPTVGIGVGFGFNMTPKRLQW